MPEVLKLQAAIMRDTHVPLPEENCEEISLNVIIRNGKIAFVRKRYFSYKNRLRDVGDLNIVSEK